VSQILELSRCTALVTGAGQGVGRQIALELGAHGAAGIVVNDYVLERAEAVAEEIRSVGGSAIAAQGDVTDRESMADVVARGTEAFGPLNTLVNNAGNGGASPSPDVRKPFWEVDRAVWDTHIGVNLYGVINSVGAVVPGMIGIKRGRIITIMSEAGRVGEAGLEIYSGAKAGAAGFTRAVARSLARYGILANIISIAATNTPAVEKQLAALDPETRKRWLERYVVRRFGEPRDVANMVTFLASEANSWITGQTYPVNGGFSFAL
jgi:2-hydroxycyclohexanecarboxyl-CoA dehydrogenase